MNGLNRLSVHSFVAVLLFVVSLIVLFVGYGPGVAWLAYGALSGILLAATWSDFYTRTIPNKYVLCALVLWIAFEVVSALISVQGNNKGLFAVVDGLVGAVMIGGFTLLLSWLLGVTRKQTVFGAGDIKLLFVTSLFLGLSRAVISLLLACVLALLLALIPGVAAPSNNGNAAKGFRSKTIPFAPAIATATFLVLAVSPFVNL